MKLFTLFFALVLSLAASASELASHINLYKIKDAESFDLSTLTMGYDPLYKSIILTIELGEGYRIPSHPEMNIFSYIAKTPEVRFEGNYVIATKDSGEEAVCAIVNDGRINETGACTLEAKVEGDVINVGLGVR